MDVVALAYAGGFMLWRLWDWFGSQVGASWR